MIWQDRQHEPIKERSLADKLSISTPVASILLHLGFSTPEQANHFLHPKLAHLDDPFNITNLHTATSRIIQAIQNKEQILIFGDYDVDGVTSATLLVTFLKEFGLDPNYVVPFRLQEGYGLTQKSVERALSDHSPRLFISLDCGTNSAKEISFIKQQGIDVIIIDHHQSKENLPQDCTLVNPHAFDDPTQPWLKLCTVGLVFKLCHGLLKQLRDLDIPKAFKIKIKNYLDFVAMGTIADLVPLLGENRILTHHGLKTLTKMQRPGIKALFKVSGMQPKQDIKPVDVSFKLGPRINASGRLSDAILPINLLLHKDASTSLSMAQSLDALNKERQAIERQVTQEAEQIVESQNQHLQHSILIYDPSWHFGVVGIVAGKLCRKYHRPCIVLGSENGLAKGSGRSINGVDFVEALKPCDDLLETWGGHPAAVGLSLNPDNVQALSSKLLQTIQSQFPKGIPKPSIKIAYWLESQELTHALLDELDLLHPFGIGNSEPIFGLKNITITTPPEVFAVKHVRFQVNTPSGNNIKAIAWNAVENIPPANKPIDLAIRFSWNHWNQRKIPQIELVDWRLAQN